jgi:hypothetical protein
VSGSSFLAHASLCRLEAGGGVDELWAKEEAGGVFGTADRNDGVDELELVENIDGGVVGTDDRNDGVTGCAAGAACVDELGGAFSGGATGSVNTTSINTTNLNSVLQTGQQTWITLGSRDISLSTELQTGQETNAWAGMATELCVLCVCVVCCVVLCCAVPPNGG